VFKEQLIVLLGSLKQPYQIKGNEIVTTCLNPEHEDHSPSYSINWVTGASYCFSCGFSHPVSKLLGLQPDDDMMRMSKYLGLNRQWEEEIEEELPEIILPPIDFMVTESIRGIPTEILMELGVYYCTHGRYKGRLILPVRDSYGNLLGFDARIYEHKDRPGVVPNIPDAKYLRPVAMKTANVLYPLDYLQHHPELNSDSITLTEGIFDALSYIALGEPAVCNFGLGSPTPSKVSHLIGLGYTAVNSGMDYDQKGIAGWQRIKEEWREYLQITPPTELTKRIWASAKDANTYLEEMNKC